MTAKCADIIARLERATGPDRDLDTLIALTINPGWEYSSPGYIWLAGCGSVNSQRIRVPCYTKSIDAAMSLVPKGRAVAIHVWPPTEYTRPGKHYHAASVVRIIENGGVKRIVRTDGHTAPLALCIAALKAQEHQP